MPIAKRISFTLILATSLLLLALPHAPARQPSSASNSSAQQAPQSRDGSHDFDPLLGSWKYHLKRRLNPLTGSNTWVDFEGTGVCRRVYDGAQIDEFHAEGPTGNIEGLTLRTYNPTSHQWRLYWANQKVGVLDLRRSANSKTESANFWLKTLNTLSITKPSSSVFAGPI